VVCVYCVCGVYGVCVVWFGFVLLSKLV